MLGAGIWSEIDGNAAVIRTCGPDDVLDFVNPSTIIEDIGGLTFPAAADDADYNVQGCTEYSLEVGKRYVKMVTTLFNDDDVERGFFVGDYINAAGQVEQWTTSGAGIGEILTSQLGVLSYIAYGEATGVDHAHVTERRRLGQRRQAIGRTRALARAAAAGRDPSRR